MSVTIHIHNPQVANHWTTDLSQGNTLFIDLKRRGKDSDSNACSIILPAEDWPAFYAELTAIDRALCPNPETPAPTSEKPE